MRIGDPVGRGRDRAALSSMNVNAAILAQAAVIVGVDIGAATKGPGAETAPGPKKCPDYRICRTEQNPRERVDWRTVAVRKGYAESD